MQYEASESKLHDLRNNLERATKEIQVCSQKLSECEMTKQRLRRELDSRDVLLTDVRTSKAQVERHLHTQIDMVWHQIVFPHLQRSLWAFCALRLHKETEYGIMKNVTGYTISLICKIVHGTTCCLHA
jgi:hypothetical protein